MLFSTIHFQIKLHYSDRSSPQTIFYSKIEPVDKKRYLPLFLQFTNLKKYFGNKATR